MNSPLVMELIVFSGRWSNNEDGTEGEITSVGGWLGCVTALNSGRLGVAIMRGMESSMDQDIKHFSVFSCSLVKPPDPVVCSTLGSRATEEGSGTSGDVDRRRPCGIVAVGWLRCWVDLLRLSLVLRVKCFLSRS